MPTLSRKICLIGDFGVGKTSLIRRFVDRQFDDRYLSTVGVKISRKAVPLPVEEGFAPNTVVQFVIWDIEGRTKFKDVTPSYLQGARGAIAVGDATRPTTVDALTDHAALFDRMAGAGELMVAVNKLDAVSRERAEELLANIDPAVAARSGPPLLTSAKTGDRVDELFETLARRLAADARLEPPPPSPPSGGGPAGNSPNVTPNATENRDDPFGSADDLLL